MKSTNCEPCPQAFSAIIILLGEDDLVLDDLLPEHQEYYAMVQSSPGLPVMKSTPQSEASSTFEQASPTNEQLDSKNSAPAVEPVAVSNQDLCRAETVVSPSGQGGRRRDLAQNGLTITDKTSDYSDGRLPLPVPLPELPGAAKSTIGGPQRFITRLKVQLRSSNKSRTLIRCEAGIRNSSRHEASRAPKGQDSGVDTSVITLPAIPEQMATGLEDADFDENQPRDGRIDAVRARMDVGEPQTCLANTPTGEVHVSLDYFDVGLENQFIADVPPSNNKHGQTVEENITLLVASGL